MANAFNDFSTDMVSQISKSPKKFETYINEGNVVMDSKP